jgi:hypothetical protein
MDLLNNPMIKDSEFLIDKHIYSNIVNPLDASDANNLICIERNKRERNKFLDNYLLFFNRITQKLNTDRDNNFEKITFEKFKNDYDKFKIFHDVDFNDIKFYSFLNFLRYYSHLFEYFEEFSFYKTFSKGEVSIVFKSSQKTLISLQLTFQTNGITRFLSQDQDSNDLEKQTYIIEGNFSSSNLISKNYKIERLMQILTSESKYNKRIRFYAFFIEENEISHEIHEITALNNTCYITE